MMATRTGKARNRSAGKDRVLLAHLTMLLHVNNQLPSVIGEMAARSQAAPSFPRSDIPGHVQGLRPLARRQNRGKDKLGCREGQDFPFRPVDFPACRSS